MNIKTDTASVSSRITMWAAVIWFVFALAVAGSELYIRWFVNLDFAFLSGFALETMIASSTALFITLVFANRKTLA